MEEGRSAARKAVVRVVGAMPPAASRLTARVGALAARDAGRTRRGTAALARAVAVIAAPRGTATAPEQPLALEEIARRAGQSLDEVTEWADRGILGDPAGPGPPRRWVGGVQRARLVAYLRRRGESIESLEAAARSGRLPLLVVELALGGRGRLSTREAARAADVTPEFAQAVLSALGMPRADPDEPLVGSREVRALRLLRVLTGVLPEDEVLDTVAVIGRAMAAIAAAEVEVYRSSVVDRFAASGMDELEMALRTAALVDLLVAPTAALLDVAHRKVLEAAVAAESILRVEAASGGLADQEVWAVAFVDIVGFTAASERLTPLALGDLSARLTRLAEAAAAEHGSRVVKSIGDAVMLAARDPLAAVTTVMALHEAAATAGLPALHAGIAVGPVLRRRADLFGRTVNVAARLCAAATADAVLLTCSDPALPARARDRGLRVEAAGPTALRGLEAPVDVLTVSRAGADGEG